jgi:hypothetical protein
MPKRHTNAVFLGDLRARTAGQIIHLERIAADVAARIADARCDLEAIDRVIRLFDARIDPSTIRPIASPKKIPRGSYGGLTKAIKTVLETAGADGLLTREVAWALQLKYGLCFETPQEFNRFIRNTLQCRLRELAKRGDIHVVTEEMPGPDACQPQNRYWLKSFARRSLDTLAAQAAGAGLEVQVVDAEAVPGT